MVTMLDPDGACRAIATHSRIASSGTGRVKSRRLRTARVVESNWSGSRSSRVILVTSGGRGIGGSVHGGDVSGEGVAMMLEQGDAPGHPVALPDQHLAQL